MAIITCFANINGVYLPIGLLTRSEYFEYLQYRDVPLNFFDWKLNKHKPYQHMQQIIEKIQFQKTGPRGEVITVVLWNNA